MYAGERADGFAVEGARVECAGEVAFGEIEDDHDACGGGSDEEGREGGGWVVVRCEGGGGGGDCSEGEGDEKSADGGRCDAFDPVVENGESVVIRRGITSTMMNEVRVRWKG